ncbi:MAG: O-antigen ligase family protein [Planctomycetota bacterium]
MSSLAPVPARVALPILLMVSSLVAGLSAPAVVRGEPWALAGGIIVLALPLLVVSGVRHLDLLLFAGLLAALVFFTAIYHRDLVQSTYRHPFYGTTVLRVTLPELLALGVVGGALGRRALLGAGGGVRAGLVPLLVAVLVLLGLTVGVARHGDFEACLRDGRKVAYVALGHLAVVLVVGEQYRRAHPLLIVAAVVAVAAAGVQLTNYLHGEAFVYGEFSRATVDVADFLVLLALVVVPAALLRLRVWTGGKIALALTLMFIGVGGTLVTFSRAAWAALPVGAAIVLLFPPQRLRPSRRLATALGLLVVMLVPFVVEGTAPLAWKRVGTLAEPESDPSLSYRLRELSGGLSVVASHPLLGLGFGTPFQVAASLEHRRAEAPTLVHNLLLWVTIKGGIPGLLLVAGIFLLVTANLVRAIRASPSRQEAALALGLLALLGIFIAIGMVGAMLNQTRTSFLLGFLSGAAQVLGSRKAPPAFAEGGR